jgi:5-methylcytosine-specific restriction endonuclease McrA
MNTQTMPCPKCRAGTPVRLRLETQHYGEIRCPVHGHAWIPKPSEQKTARRKVNPDLFELAPEDMRDFCWTCLRSRELFKSLQPTVVLQAHHIIEVQHGGTDTRDNIQIVCAECHSAIHRTREAFNRYTVHIETEQ